MNTSLWKKHEKFSFAAEIFASIDGAGLGFNNRRTDCQPLHFQGRVQHLPMAGYLLNAVGKVPILLWTVQGDERLLVSHQP